MTWEASSGKIYKLCLLDTNALSEIVKNPTQEGRGFKERFGPENYVPCFTVYNLIELRRKEKVYEAFLNFFSMFPFFLLKTSKQIGNEEFNLDNSKTPISPVYIQFSPLDHNPTTNLRDFVNELFRNPKIVSLEKNWRSNEDDTMKVWEADKKNFNPSKPTANSVDADRYVKEAGIETLKRLSPKWSQCILKEGKTPNMSLFPSLQVMLYSQYYRLFDSNWRRRPQEVTDVMITAVASYVDVIVTESFQADIFRKICRKIDQLENLQVEKIRELRPKN
jgi:hypothetical protein